MSAKITTTSTKTITVPLADFLRMLTSDPRQPDAADGFHDMRRNPDAYICTNGSETITVKVQRKPSLNASGGKDIFSVEVPADILDRSPEFTENYIQGMTELFRSGLESKWRNQPVLDLTKTNPDRVSGK